MKAFKIAAVILLTLFSSFASAENPINPVIGNKSYQVKFGCEPTENTPEDLRISTHLSYVYETLSSRSVKHLSPEMQKRRKYMLSLLKDYVERGQFPRNYDKQERCPCFIDKNGTICAVGYLVEQSVGRNVAEYINQKYKYSKIADMHDPILKLWIANSGLTETEIATIQPAYGNPPQDQPAHVTPAYGISSSLLIGTNATFMTINSVQIANGSPSLATPIIGIATGIGQLSLGSAMYPKETYDSWTGTYTTNEGLKGLSIANIAMGTSTIALSTWNLINYCRNKKKNKFTSWGVYTYPATKTDVGVAFTFSHKF